MSNGDDDAGDDDGDHDDDDDDEGDGCDNLFVGEAKPPPEWVRVRASHKLGRRSHTEPDAEQS